MSSSFSHDPPVSTPGCRSTPLPSSILNTRTIPRFKIFLAWLLALSLTLAFGGELRADDDFVVLGEQGAWLMRDAVLVLGDVGVNRAVAAVPPITPGTDAMVVSGQHVPNPGRRGARGAHAAFGAS